MKSVGLNILAVLINLLIVSTGQADTDKHSTSQLRLKVSEYVKKQLHQLHYQRYEIQVSSIDSRLRLPLCPNKYLSLFIPHNQSITQASTIGVQCSRQSQDWKIYIPVKIKVLTNTVVTSHPLAKNYLIKRRDVKLILADIKKSRNGHYTQLNDVIGKLTKRNLRSGQLISPNYLKLPQIMKKGDRVTITALNKAINVSMKGIALENGQVGEVIRVKNLSSARIIDAKIVAHHQVEIKI